MPWLRPTVGGQLVLQRPALDGGEHKVHVLDQQVRRAGKLHGEAGVQHVRRGHALVQEARLGAHDLGDVGQEGDHVVLGGALDLIDAFGLEGRLAAELPDRRRRFLGDHAQLRHGVGGVRLDLKPDAIASLGGPQGRHFGAGITGDHELPMRGRRAQVKR